MSIVLTKLSGNTTTTATCLPAAMTRNAIVLGSGPLTTPKIAKARLVLNLFGIVLASIVALTLALRFLQG